MSRRKLHVVSPRVTWVIALLLFAATAALFSRAIGNGFVNFDDDVYVYANSRVNGGLSFAGVIGAFLHAHARNWHPLTTISHMVDCQVLGLNPAGAHAVNVLLHAITAAGLFFILHQTTRSIWRATVVAALFAFHPLRVESVAWISERKDVLSAFFFMATLLAYVHFARAPNGRRMLVVSALFAAGLMSKPMLVSLPIVLLLIDFWPLRRIGGTIKKRAQPRISVSRALLEKVPLFVLAGLSCLATIWAARGSSGELDALPLTNRISNAAVSYCIYIYQLIWPDKLAAFYPFPPQPVSLGIALAAISILLAISAAAYAARRRAPYFLTGWCWYIIMLGPVIGIWQIGLQAHADRYTYLPHIGLLIALTWGAVDLLRRLRVRSLAFAAVATVLVLLGWRTWQQIGFWRDSETLWRHALSATGVNDVALSNLGGALQDRGDLDGALANYRAALQVLEQRPESRYKLSRALVHNNIGNNLARRNQLQEAKAEYRRCISLRPDFANGHVNLAQAFARQQDWSGALAEYEQALHWQPDDPDAHHRAGVAALRLGRVDQAIAHYKEALACDPQLPAAELDLGNVLLQQGQVEEAANHYRRAIAIDHRSADAHFNLGRVYFGQGRMDDAITEYSRVVAITPTDPEAHNNLANALAANGSEKSGRDEYEKALGLAPQSVSVLNNLAWLLATSADTAVRDSTRAIVLAEEAKQLAPKPHPLIYHTLAAAYAAAGKTADALQAAERAQQLAEAQGNTKLAERLRNELANYRKNAAISP